MQQTLEDYEVVATYKWAEIPEGQYYPIANLNLSPEMMTKNGSVYRSENKGNKTATELILDSEYVYNRFSKLLSQLGLKEVKDIDKFLGDMKKYHLASAEREYLASIRKIAEDMANLKGGTVEEWVAKLK